MPLLVENGRAPQALSAGTLEVVPRNCTLEEYKKIKNIKTFAVKGEFIAYASPDSTYAVTSKLLNAATKEIVIGIYDLSASYVKEMLLNALQRGVKVTLMLDIDSNGEQEIFDELDQFGCTAVPAPSCASDVISYFPSSHEKVIIIDETWVLVQSGNYSTNSIPFNEIDGGDPKKFKKGNRDMGVAIKSKPLATFFKKVLKSDIKLQLDASGPEAVAPKAPVAPTLVERVPKLIPSKLFPSKTFNPSTPVRVTPVLTPDNYMDLIPTFLESARKSILIENQYIRGSHTEIIKLLAAIKTALDKKPDLDVRIILGKIFGQKDVEKEKKNLLNIKKTFGLALGGNIRFINTDRFVHCHNKLIIVDNKSVLISSQNWSNTGVGTNREAGVLIEYPEISKYYAKIFESDWDTAFKNIPKVGKETVTPEVLATGNYLRVVAADYQEV